MSKGISKRFEREDWDDFIFHFMRHALLREVFNAEMNRSYTGAFVLFMTENQTKWRQGDANDDLF